MTMTIAPIFPDFGGEVSGAKLTRPLTPEEVATIDAGMDRFAVLAFHDQDMTDERQREFGARFGTLEETNDGGAGRRGERRIGRFVEDVSNLDDDNRPLVREDPRRVFLLGNRLWHSDSSFRTTPPKYSILSGRVTVNEGGCTEFADMRAAYDGLDASTKAEIEGLMCEHSWIHSRSALGLGEVSAGERAAFRPVRQPLVRTHPVTGRKSLFLSSHIGAIEGWPAREARDFIASLTDRALAACTVYSHVWRPCDLLMWDNRTTMHRVTYFDETKVRDLRRVTVAGDAN